MNEVPWYISLIVSWLPFLFLIGMWVWITRAITSTLRTKDGRALAQVLDEHVRELRRQNDLLAEAIKGQRQRPEALEQNP
jgi:hypothetical protein